MLVLLDFGFGLGWQFMWGVTFRVYKVYGLGFRVEGLGFRVGGLGFRV